MQWLVGLTPATPLSLSIATALRPPTQAEHDVDANDGEKDRIGGQRAGGKDFGLIQVVNSRGIDQRGRRSARFYSALARLELRILRLDSSR